MNSLFRCAHISDLHFSTPTWHISQFFSKRWIGNFNLILSRKKEYTDRHLASLIETFEAQNISHVFITGDLSSTSLPSEFQKALKFVTTLKTKGFQVFIVPGNHDQYTKNAYRNQFFYQFFDPLFSDKHPYSLTKDKVSATHLGDKWWLVGLDTTLATPLLSSYGSFSEMIEQNLYTLLSTIPKEHHILMMNHFPVFKLPSPRATLLRAEALQRVFKQFPNIRFYLHGHTHRHCVADLQGNHLPIILDSGSTAHRKIGSWNLLQISTNQCIIDVYRLKKINDSHQKKSWEPSEQHLFQWS